MTDIDRFRRLLRAGHRCVFVPTHEERELLTLVNEACMSESLDVLQWSATLGLREATVNGGPAVADTEKPQVALTYLATLRKRVVAVMCDLVPSLDDARTLRFLREAIEAAERTGSHLVLLDHRPDLPPVLRSHAVTFEPALPGPAEVERLVRAVARELVSRQQLKVELNRKDLDTLVRNLSGLSLRQARQIVLDVTTSDGTLNAEDVNEALAQKRRMLESAGALEYVESPVSLDQIGGLRALKRWLGVRKEAIFGDAAGFGVEPPRGVLMLGVQGAGKSLSAKAVATAWQRPLLRLDAGALYDRYVGESEKRLREALKQAEAMAPVVLWIDEIEKAFASAAQSTGGGDGGLSKRMFGTLLTWMQEHRAPVFLIATANDISALPPELLRKGRFDEIFFVDLPDDEARGQILSIHLKKRKRDPGTFDLSRLIAASKGYSGAEIEQAIRTAVVEAWSGKTEVTTDMLEHALKSSPPLSVTMAERLEALRDWAKDRCVPAD